jgi:Phosphotransferase enzyme family
MATDTARERLAAFQPLVRNLAAELTLSPVPVSLEHGDLHGNNVLVGSGGVPATASSIRIRLFDWGDAVVAHPFATLTTTLGSIGYYAGLDAYGPELEPVLEAHVAAWADLAPHATLRRHATLAMDLGHIGKVAAWERALQGLDRDEMAGFHGGSAAWLRDLAARLETW